MKKANGSWNYTAYTSTDGEISRKTDIIESIDIVCTFEKPVCYSNKLPETNLNRMLLFNLSQLGVPDAYFEKLLEETLKDIPTITNKNINEQQSNENRYKIYKTICRKIKPELFGIRDKMIDSFATYDKENEENKSDDDEQLDNSTTIFSQNVKVEEYYQPKIYYSNPMEALQLLEGGFEINEPRLIKLLHTIINSEFMTLKEKFQFKISDSVYLVGIPDPLGVLEEGQVFICLYAYEQSSSSAADGFCTATRRSIIGKVVVTRSPM